VILRYHLDANVVLRFLRNDDPQQSQASARLFENAKAGKVRLAISAVTIAETFYVLARVYKHTRPDAAAKLLPLIQTGVLDVEDRSCVVDALQRVIKANVDFGDGFLASTAAAHGELIASFDADLQLFSDVTTVVPA
jgi:predicted nucleic acid-binding protein